MANSIYPKFKKRSLLTGGNLVTGAVKAILVDTTAYTRSDAHEFLSEILAGARVGAGVALTTKTVSDLAVFDADDFTVTGLTSAPTVEAIVLYVDTGVESTSYLVAYIDTATGLPTAAGQATVAVVWDNGANKIFKL